MKLDTLVRTIAEIHTRSQAAAGQALNRLLALRNWLIGAWIVEYDQGGEDRAAYGDRLLHRLAEGLIKAASTLRFSGPSTSCTASRKVGRSAS